MGSEESLNVLLQQSRLLIGIFSKLVPAYITESLGLISAPNISAMDITAQTFRLLGRFGTCTFRHRGHFDTWTLRHRAISAQGHFGTGDISAHGCFGTLDVSAHGHFGTADISACGHFGAVDVSARGHFGTVDISARGFFDTGLFGTGFFSTFQVRNFLTWTFRHVDISAWWTFRHGDFSGATSTSPFDLFDDKVAIVDIDSDRMLKVVIDTKSSINFFFETGKLSRKEVSFCSDSLKFSLHG